METKNSQRRISETIRKIALACSIDRVDMSHCKTGGVETARVILIRHTLCCLNRLPIIFYIDESPT